MTVATAPLVGRGVIALSVTDTAARFQVPTSWAGKLVIMTSNGADCDVLFGGSTVACTYGQASGVSTEVITINAATGAHLENGISRSFRLPRAEIATHFSVDCVGSGTSTLYLELAD